MKKDRLTRKTYATPNIRVKEIAAEPFMVGTTETLPFDQNDGTEEALSKEGSIWDDYVPVRGNNELFDE